MQHSADRPPAQTDIFLVTSFSCYTHDIARPFEGRKGQGLLYRALDTAWGYTFSRNLTCVCLEHCHAHGCPVAGTAMACPTPLSCLPRTVQSSFMVPSDNKGLLRWPPTRSVPQGATIFDGPPHLLVKVPSLASFGLWFNRSRSYDLTSDVRCLCDVNATAWSSATQLKRTPWLPQGFRQCIAGRPLFDRPAPWCLCGEPTAGDVSCTDRAHS